MTGFIYEVEIGDLRILVIPTADMMYSQPPFRTGRENRVTQQNKEKAIRDIVGVGRYRYDYVVVLDSSKTGLSSVSPIRRKLLYDFPFEPQIKKKGTVGGSHWILKLGDSGK